MKGMIILHGWSYRCRCLQEIRLNESVHMSFLVHQSLLEFWSCILLTPFIWSLFWRFSIRIGLLKFGWYEGFWIEVDGGWVLVFHLRLIGTHVVVLQLQLIVKHTLRNMHLQTELSSERNIYLKAEPPNVSMCFRMTATPIGCLLCVSPLRALIRLSFRQVGTRLSRFGTWPIVNLRPITLDIPVTSTPSLSRQMVRCALLEGRYILLHFHLTARVHVFISFLHDEKQCLRSTAHNMFCLPISPYSGVSWKQFLLWSTSQRIAGGCALHPK